ncbi:A24 family peptidase [Alkalibacillus haloalkaliphilus]|uniref:A24 family peptidase n=1 Tax=Alkalibacillus haloalkaliphilus TaxID=94136 RepID=UPI0029362CDD|nr:A24 family peptidase [Alkalibacillus haloalkaliphilus]MDV2581346.1 A24 family peptidase [Alkalibacillus haloalkaliphilus]
MTVINTLLLIVLLICLVTDLKERKIYNKILLPSFVAALLLNSFFYGLSGLSDALLGSLIGFAILLIPYLMGGMGAGDVKLLAVIGAFQGPMFVVATAIYMALLGGLVGLGMIIFRKGLIQRVRGMFRAILNMRYGIKPKCQQSTLKMTFPYGVAIVGGAVASFLLDGVVM